MFMLIVQTQLIFLPRLDSAAFGVYDGKHGIDGVMRSFVFVV